MRKGKVQIKNSIFVTNKRMHEKTFGIIGCVFIV